MKKVGVLLSGCGVQDGSEIHEAVVTLLALDRAGVEVICMAPDVEQRRVVDHVTGQAQKGERRNVLHESARIARGKVRDLASVQARELDALVLPGGFGAATNLCDFATAGADAKVNPEVARLGREVHAQQKPLGFMCIAPALAAAIFRGTGVSPRLTVGDDGATAHAMEQMGAKHVKRGVDEIEVDEANRIVSTPAYMLADRIADAALGIDRLVKKIVEMAG